MRRTLLALSPALVAFVAFACQPPQEEMAEPARTAQAVQADFDALRAEWQNLANAGDFAGVAALYTPDAVFIDVHGNVYNGRDAISGYLESSFASSTDLNIQTTDMVMDGDMVAAYGTFSQTVAGPEGDMPMDGMWVTVSLYQPDGSVQIRLHQSMLPAEPPSGM
jgi:uncharacterized protein (TIGR02246 family)